MIQPFFLDSLKFFWMDKTLELTKWYDPSFFLVDGYAPRTDIMIQPYFLCIWPYHKHYDTPLFFVDMIQDLTLWYDPHFFGCYPGFFLIGYDPRTNIMIRPSLFFWLISPINIMIQPSFLVDMILPSMLWIWPNH